MITMMTMMRWEKYQIGILPVGIYSYHDNDAGDTGDVNGGVDGDVDGGDDGDVDGGDDGDDDGDVDGVDDGDGAICNQAGGESKTKAATSLENYCSQIELHSPSPFLKK